MSNNVIKIKENYIQSPSDDIESFFWTFFWAVLQNNTVNHSDQERMCADNFRNGLRDTAIRDYMYLVTETSPLIAILTSMVIDWENVVGTLSKSYLRLSICLTDINKAGHFKDAEEAQYWKAVWHGFALKGVCESLKVLLKYFTD